MPLDTKLVGQQTQTFTHHADARWLMAYVSGINDPAPCYMDTEIRADVIAHPVFPVCLEWPVILDARALPTNIPTTADETRRGVHASHDLHILKPIRAGDTLRTKGTVIGIERIKPGAAETIRLDTYNQHDELVTRTYQLSISRGVEIAGPAKFKETPPAWPLFNDTEKSETSHNTEHEIPVATGAANIYTETAHIFNPIHTDRAVALAAGLPDIILHGTATLAMAVSTICHNYVDNQPERITRLGGRFSSMVLMPSTLTLKVHQVTRQQTAGNQQSVLFYSLTTNDNTNAISNGFVCWE